MLPDQQGMMGVEPMWPDDLVALLRGVAEGIRWLARAARKQRFHPGEVALRTRLRLRLHRVEPRPPRDPPSLFLGLGCVPAPVPE
jgi:hypothetical protein